MAAPIRTSMASILPVLRTRLVAVTGLDANVINPWLGDDPPHLAGQYDLVLRLAGFSPDWQVGGGRITTEIKELLEVQIRTRLALDSVGSALQWLTEATYGHIRMRALVLDALQGFMPLDSSSNVLTTAALLLVPSRAPRPDIKGGAVNWGSETLTFKVCYLQSLPTTTDS